MPSRIVLAMPLSPHRLAADAAVPALQAQFGTRLLAVALFGSVARGTERPDSDVDLLIVLADLPASPRARWHLVEPALAPIEAALREVRPHACLAPVLRTSAEIARGGPLYYDLTLPEERVLLHDPHGVLGRALVALADRMRALGSTRRKAGGAWYWELAPGRGLGFEPDV